jgi:hypothetical protein
MEGTVRHFLGDARMPVSRQVKQRNCIRYYNKSCDSGAQKTNSNNSFVWVGGKVHICYISTYPYDFKILWEINHQSSFLCRNSVLNALFLSSDKYKF